MIGVQSIMFDEVKNSLREAYDQKVEQREQRTIQPWKLEERSRFLTLLEQEERKTVLEIGAGTGIDSSYFQSQGFDVTCVDLSTEMVKMCQKKGLTAYVMDVCNLCFAPASFDAVYSLNCLLHLPKAEFPIALDGINALLKPDGLLYLGLYGGRDQEGIWKDDAYEPKRFFSFQTDSELQKQLRRVFDLVSFRQLPFDGGKSGLHFQSAILRRRDE